MSETVMLPSTEGVRATLGEGIGLGVIDFQSNIRKDLFPE